MTTEQERNPFYLLRSIHPEDALEILLEYVKNQDSDLALFDHIRERWSPGTAPEPRAVDDAPVFYKTRFSLTVLSTEQCDDMGLEQLGSLESESELFTLLTFHDQSRVKPSAMRREIATLDSDTEMATQLLLGDDHWKYEIRRGSEVIYTPEGESTPKRVGRLIYVEHHLETCTLSWHQGEYLVAKYDEISQP